MRIASMGFGLWLPIIILQRQPGSVRGLPGRQQKDSHNDQKEKYEKKYRRDPLEINHRKRRDEAIDPIHAMPPKVAHTIMRGNPV